MQKARRVKLSAAEIFAKGKREVISWTFDDAASDIGSVYINSDVNPSLNFKSSASAAILAKFTGWSATSPMITRGPDGTLKHANHNLCYNSDDQNSRNKQNCTVASNTHTPPGASSATADTITANAGFAYHYVTAASGTAPIGTVVKGFFRIKKGTSDWAFVGVQDNSITTVDLANGVIGTLGGSDTAEIEAVSDGYYDVTITHTVISTSTLSAAVGVANSTSGTQFTAVGTETIIVAYVDLKAWPCHSTEHIVTGANPVFHIPTTYDTSGNKLGFLDWEARTNAAWWSRDLTQSAWTRTNCTAAKTATGTDGEANSASTLTASAANATCLQSITAASAQRVSSCSIKRRTGTGTIEMTQDNGTTWTPITVTSEWTPVEIPAATVTNPIVGFRIVTSGDAIDVDHVQCEIGAKASPPIITAGAAVTRAAGDFAIARSLYSGSDVPISLVAWFRKAETTTRGVAVAEYKSGTPGAAVALDGNSDGQVRAYSDGGTTAYFLSMGAYSANALIKSAIGVASNDANASYNGNIQTQDTSVAPVTSRTGLSVGMIKDGGASGTAHINGVVARFKAIPERLSDAELQLETA